MLPPLEGIRILDMTRLLPGPLGTMMLAEMGAEVIKIESPNSHDMTRDVPPDYNGVAAFYLALNRSKKSMLIDYKKDSGRHVLMELIKTADVVIEQFRPGVMDSLKIGYEDARKVKEDIIYVSLTGYGQTGPYAKMAGHDLNYLAVSGILSLLTDEHGKPIIPGIQLADIAAGSYLTVSATLGALVGRLTSKQGRHVDVSMTDGLLPMLALPAAQLWGEKRAITKKDIMLAGNIVNYNVYQCADKKWIALGALEPKFWFAFCNMVDKQEWQQYIIPQQAEADNAKEKLAHLFATKTSEEWVVLASAHDTCLSPILTLSELEENDNIKSRNMIFELDHPISGKTKNLGNPLSFGRLPETYATPAPEKGQHTEEILKELGINESFLNET